MSFHDATHQPDRPDDLANGRPMRLRIRTPDDLLAAVSVVLGFEPTHSLALLTFGPGGRSAPDGAGARGGGGGTGPHLRIGLPGPDDGPEALAEVVEATVAPCRRFGVASVAAVVYTDDAALGAATAALLEEACAAAGIGVVALLRADGERWYVAGTAAPAPGRGAGEAGAPYRIDSHPARAEAVLRGQVVLGSREDLAALLAPSDEDERAPVADAVARRGAPRAGAEESAWVRETVTRAARTGIPLGAGDAARLLVALRLGQHRDAAWDGVGRVEAHRYVDMWLDLVRRAPAGWRSAPAALAALTAWLHGSGALAWCAVDVCLAEEPGHALGTLLRDLLEAATPPSWWEDLVGMLGDPA
ncbi:MAG TPA: DUF4192 domain-containing protein [Nocardioides sp.]